MSIPKVRYCDCCGKEIPYDSNIIHTEYDGHVVNCIPYVVHNDGNKDFYYFSKKGDKIFGLVDINMHRSNEVSTVVKTDCMNGRCEDICCDCKLEFLENTIACLKKYGR